MKKSFYYGCVFSVLVMGLPASVAIAQDAAKATDQEMLDFEAQVREVAERTAEEARTKRENAKAAQSNSSGTPLKVFKYRKGESVVFADSAPYKTRYEVIIYNSCYACAITSSIDWLNTRLHMSEFSDVIARVSRQYQVDQSFIRAVIHAESGFNPLARSRKGAVGLMQLMPDTARDMGVPDSTNPAQNIQGGVKYLAYLLQMFKGNQTLAAAAYNAGPNAVTRHGGVPPIEETQTYVKRVRILSERYKNQAILANN